MIKLYLLLNQTDEKIAKKIILNTKEKVYKEVENYIHIKQSKFPITFYLFSSYLLSGDEMNELKSLSDNDIEVRLILPNGDSIKVNDINKVISNKDNIMRMIYDELMKDINKNIEKASNLKNSAFTSKLDKDSIIHTNKDELQYIKGCMLESACLDILNDNLDMKKDQYVDYMTTALKDLNADTEMDYILECLTKYLSKEQMEDLDILEAEYNGEKKTKDEIIDILDTHKLPGRMIKQIPVEDTLNDSWKIKTQFCTIVRDGDGTGRFVVLKNDD